MKRRIADVCQFEWTVASEERQEELYQEGLIRIQNIINEQPVVDDANVPLDQNHPPVSAVTYYPTHKDLEIALAASKIKVTQSLAAKIETDQDDILPPRVVTVPTEHIDNSDKLTKQSMIQFALQACVARMVPRSEMLRNYDAKAAMTKEWTRLRTAKCSSKDNNVMDMTGAWDEVNVMEYEDAVRMANDLGQTWHFGRLLEFCVEKGSELPKGDKNRKWNGRVVFQGDQVRIQNYEIAVFSDMASQPATLEASAAAELFGLLDGNDTEVADAVQAYIQARLRGENKTYVHIPYHQWPDQWKKANGGKGMRRPVCELKLALYGHPQSGAFWEEHAEQKLLSEGWTTIDAWPSCYGHEKLKTFLVLYVEDFKISKPKSSLKEAWETVTKHINIDPPTKMTEFLGCKYEHVCVGYTPVTQTVVPRDTSNDIYEDVPNLSGLKSDWPVGQPKVANKSKTHSKPDDLPDPKTNNEPKRPLSTT